MMVPDGEKMTSLPCARSLLMLPLVQHSSPTARLNKYVSFLKTVRVIALLIRFPPNSVAGKTVTRTTQMPAFAISIIVPTVEIRMMMVFMIVREIAMTKILIDFPEIRKIVPMVQMMIATVMQTAQTFSA
jgi:hypothetical protein